MEGQRGTGERRDLVLRESHGFLPLRGVSFALGRVGRIDVGDFLVELALRQPDLADALELLLEVLVAQTEPPRFRRSSSIAKPLMVNSSTTRVAHLRNCTARSELTLYPTA